MREFLVRARFMWSLWTAASIAIVYSVFIFIAIRTLLGSRAYAKAFAACCVLFAIVLNIALFWLSPWNTVNGPQSVFDYVKNIFIFEWPVLLAVMAFYSLQCWEDEDSDN